MLIFYGLAGIGITLFSVAKILNGKLGAGVGRKELGRIGATPAPSKSQMERGAE